MLTRIVIHDEARRTRERFLPEHMWKLLRGWKCLFLMARKSSAMVFVISVEKYLKKEVKLLDMLKEFITGNSNAKLKVVPRVSLLKVDWTVI